MRLFNYFIIKISHLRVAKLSITVASPIVFCVIFNSLYASKENASVEILFRWPVIAKF